MQPGTRTHPAPSITLANRGSESGLDPDQWFPVSADPGRARQEAATAIAICTTCPVRGHCLTLSLRRWDIGQHGVWGGLVAADRARLRRRAHPHRGRTQERGDGLARCFATSGA
jgi:Transcription factor WhiB